MIFWSNLFKKEINNNYDKMFKLDLNIISQCLNELDFAQESPKTIKEFISQLFVSYLASKRSNLKRKAGKQINSQIV